MYKASSCAPADFCQHLITYMYLMTRQQTRANTSTNLWYKNGDLGGGQNSKILRSKVNFHARSGL